MGGQIFIGRGKGRILEKMILRRTIEDAKQ
jgi:hypothetical protein